MPNFLRSFLLEIFTSKMTFGFSNVPGPKNPFCVTGCKSNSIGFAMPVGKTIPGSLGIISNADCIKAVITTDKGCADPKVLQKYFEKSLDDILGNAEWREWSSSPK